MPRPGVSSAIYRPFERNVEPIRFMRQPPREMLGPAFLSQLTGIYDMGGVDVEIVLREDNVLLGVILGDPLELVPVRGTTFRVKDLTGVTVEFLRGADGKVNRMVQHGTTELMMPRKK
jgi:hypothetical protein